jgi:hypothetical protein
MSKNILERYYLKDEEKPQKLIESLNNFFQAKLASQVNSIEEMIDAHMSEYISNNGYIEDLQHISFHIELENNKFILKPHNFFTYLLSEGIYVPYKLLGENFIYRTNEGMYKMEKNNNEYTFSFIPNKYLA